MSVLTPAADTSAADWIVAAMQTFAESPLSLVPDSFPCYVRVFHPAYKLAQDAPQPWLTLTPVRWSDVAAAMGTQAHPGMHLAAIAQTWRALTDPLEGVFDSAPRVGTLPQEIASLLAGVLAKHTATPERCWFAVWNGFAETRDDIRLAPTFSVPARSYFLLHGPIEAINENALAGFRWQSANIWWPDDHAWCVATEIDLNDTYVACAQQCCDALLAAPELEAMEVDTATGIGWRSDTINPLPNYGS
jgi:hypothetical protein